MSNQPYVDPALVQLAQQGQVPTHHRPPMVEYRDGIPYHYTVGQPPAPQHVVVQLPEQGGMSQAQREFAFNIVLMLVVAVVLCGCVCGVVVICGGTLMGIIGAVSAAAIPVALSAVALLATAGWAATRIRTLAGKTAAGKTARKEKGINR